MPGAIKTLLEAEYHVTEDTKEDRRPKTNRTVNDRVALQKGGNRNGGLHDNS